MNNDCNGITLNVSEKVKKYIDSQTTNRTEWMIEAGKELLDILYKFLIPLLPERPSGKTIITISKPGTTELEDIYELVTKYYVSLSRSEFYRFAAIIKIIMDDIKKKTESDSNSDLDPAFELEKQLKKDRREGIVRVPLKEKGTKGETLFKAYKILRKLEY